jgi:DNA-binding CsgD family transcriptional regulator
MRIARREKFVARDRERDRAIAAIAAGRGAAIVGAAGVGKTALAAAVVRHLNPSRYGVVWTAATEASRQVPFGVFATLPPTVESPPRKARIGPAPPAERMAAELARRAGRRTPVLVVDDAHRLDGPSAAVVLGLAAAGDVRLLITAGTDVALSDAVVALWKDQYVRRLDLKPFDRDETAGLMCALLDGDVAGPTVELLHQWTGGSPLFLTELVRHGREAGHLVHDGGLWWWRSPLTVPPALAELFDQRINGLCATSRDALAATALGGPLPLSAVETVAPGVVEELEDQQLLRTGAEGAQLVVRPAHQVLAAAVRRRVSPARQRRVAAALLAATGPAELDVVTRAQWQLAARQVVDVGLLVRASGMTLHSDPELAGRLARRALEQSGTAAAAVALADSLVEAGDTAQARLVLHRARDTARSPMGRLGPAIALAGLRCWADRDPDGAHDELLRLRATTSRRTALDELAGADALVLLFAGRPAESLRVAERVVCRSPHSPEPGRRRGTLRARLAHAAALALVGRTADAIIAAESLAADTGKNTGGPPYVPGMSHAVYALARVWRTPSTEVPGTDPMLGRWPCEPADRVPGRHPMAWPLFDGYVRRLRGDRAGAIARLREAVVQQSGGYRLFRSEAAAWLAICLAEDGRPDDAARVLAESPPDRVAVMPGLGAWAAAAVAAARGDRARSAAHIEAAIAAARAAGCWIAELGYLTYPAEAAGPGPAGRGPDAPGSTAVADRLRVALDHVDAPRLGAAGAAVLALFRRDGTELLDHAVRVSDAGLPRLAWRLAEAATAALTERNDARRGAAVVLAGRLRRGLALPAPVAAPAGLTAREMEIAALAAAGHSDREISRRLVISVRTVQSHLTRVYGKLGVNSRRDLPRCLGE